MSELPRAFAAVNEDLLTREESGSHVVWLLLPSDCEPVPSDGTVERCGFQRSWWRSNVRDGRRGMGFGGSTL